jgi:ABC-2 type transport system permease protein
MSQPDVAPAGVIHDIGYRGYAGDRLGRGGIRYALFTHGLRGAFGLGRSGKSKIIPFGLVGVMLLPAVIIATIVIIGGGEGPISTPAYAQYAGQLTAATWIFVAVQAPQTVSLDMRFGTLPLYMSRPLTRGDYVMAKIAALTAAVFLLMATPIVILYLGAVFAELPLGENSAAAGWAILGAVLYSAVFSGIGLLIASLTPRRGFGIAAIITVLALSYTVVSGMQGAIGHGMGDERLAGWLGLFSPNTLLDGVQVWAFDAGSSSVLPPPDGAGPVFLLVALAVVGVCYAALAGRYRKVRL